MQNTHVGIVELTNSGGFPQIRFRKPYFILSFMGFLLFLFLVIQVGIFFKFKGSGAGAMMILIIPMIITILQFHKTYTHTCSIDLQDGMIVCNLNGNSVKHIDIKKIHGITANETAERFIDAECVPKRPAILIVAEPENATIIGPRKFTDAEANFLLKVLNDHRHSIKTIV